MATEVPSPVVEFLRDQLLMKGHPKQEAIEITYNYWKGESEFLRIELPDKEDCLKALERVARDIRNP